VTAAAARKEEALRERRCIVTGENLADDALMRFAVSPDGDIVPDVAAKLPGRGIWVSATRAAVDEAVKKNLFGRAAKANVKADTDLSARVEKMLLARMLGDLGLAKRSGALTTGFDNVLRTLESARPPAVLVEALDGAADGKRKLFGAAHARELELPVVECLTTAELGLALGRENVIHAALNPGGFAQRLVFDAGRLKGFRSSPEQMKQATNARNERHV
jgi:predicted RNA-binding protein YlxR (DUF448 family)